MTVVTAYNGAQASVKWHQSQFDSWQVTRADGTTIYTGREAAGVLTRNPDTGERIRVLPFGFVAQGKAADPAALLNVALTVGADGIIQRIAVDWGTGASAWTFTVAYSHLGRTAPLAAPAGPTTGATAS